jgi:UDP-N-acetylmuramoylalanine--D-glutamate ligase
MSALQSKLPSKISKQKCKILIKAVHQSFKDAKNLDLKNSVVLLSPGAASFDQFNNFEHRGNEFKRIVRSI